MARTRNRVAGTAWVVSLLMLVPLAAAAAEDGDPSDLSSGEATSTSTYVVQVDTGTTDVVADKLAELGATPGSELVEVLDGFTVDLTTSQAQALAAIPEVAAVSADQVIAIASTQASAPWGLDRIDQSSLPLDGQFTYATSAGAGVTVYVVDTGVTANPTFGTRLASGYTTVTDGYGTTDCHGHGTHVAGIVASTAYGVAKAATVVPVRVLDCSGYGMTSQLITAFEWIAAHHAPGVPAVVNLSLGGPVDGMVNAAVAGLVADGLTVVAAAGNAATNAPAVDACGISPASAPSALTVGASTRADGRASFSNWGSCLDLFAPGDGIVSLSTSPAVATTYSGTSSAAPHVAGVAALYLAENPAATPAQVTASLLANAVSVIANPGPATTSRLLSSRVTADTGAVPPTLTPTERYVTSVYASLFGRAPDPAGMATWTRALDSGAPRNAVADAITGSAEYRSGLIRDSYRTYLGREPDAEGLRNWLDAMSRGLTIQELQAGFVASPEFYQRSGSTPSGWVNQLYTSVLGRGAGASEVDFWTARIAGGASHWGVALGFLLSSEHLGSAIDGQYQHLLGRGIDPTGRATWVGAIQNGVRFEGVIGSIIASNEYYSTHQ